MGDEWILPVACDVESLKECAAAIGEVWTRAVVEDTLAHEFAYEVDALLPSEDSELCVYRDLEVARRWQRGEPADGALHNSMIQISLATYGLRLITDDWQDPRLAPVVEKAVGWAAPTNRNSVIAQQ